jgi:hypothetical protein
VYIQPIGLQVFHLLAVGRSDPLSLDGHFVSLTSEDRLVKSRGGCLHLHRHGLSVNLSMFIAVGTKLSLSFYEMRDVCSSSFTRSFTFTVTFNYFKTHCYTYSQTSNYHVPFHVSSAAISEARLRTVHVARSYECMSQS